MHPGANVIQPTHQQTATEFAHTHLGISTPLCKEPLYGLRLDCPKLLGQGLLCIFNSASALDSVIDGVSQKRAP